MNRITRDQLYMEIASLFAKRSTCYRQNIGAVIVHDNRIVAHGYNGSPAGQPHCQGQCCELTESGGCKQSVHAEINALAYCPPRLHNLTLYTTISPCTDCAREIAYANRFDKVFYNTEYRKRDGIEYLLARGIEVYRITASGYVINAKDGALVL